MTDPTNPNDGETDGVEDLVAVVGMAGRFPESPDIDHFWANLRAGRDCLHTFTDDELAELGIPLEAVQVDNFVRRGTRLPDRDGFDARFFGYTPKQAATTDPQARIFLETCYEALEHAGYNPFDPGSPVGVFAGSNPNDYALLLGVADPSDSLGAFDQLIGVDRDFVATRVSHKLGLTGPAMTIQTACSTSLVTVHAAVQSLLAFECTMALAGGVSINLRQGIGYFYQPGMILSPTGECRAFDARAEGTTLGQGCGVVVLKRLAEAQDDGDHILAVIRATAINNDGSNKIGYTAPSEDGQVEVISTAHALAGIESDSIGYVETHGTGTLLGDPIEIAALTRAFKPGTDRLGYCAIGSAKTNFGHLDAAAGITGFMKAVLSLYHCEIPPSIHFDEPNPTIDFANSPFFVNTELRPFPAGPTPRRAGVSAFGIGGTNAHVVLEEPPRPTGENGGDADTSERPRVLTLSARTASAADARISDLAKALSGDGAPPLRAVDYTLRHGRPELEHRRAVVVGPNRALADTVAGNTDGVIVRGDVGELGLSDVLDPSPVWIFAGQGAQYVGMGAGLYDAEPVYRDAFDRVSDHVADALGVDLRAIIDPPTGHDPEAASEQLRQTSMTQPALFAVEHATAALLRSWGQEPRAVIGHSIGEYAAAVEAGIMTWSDAADLVVERGRLMQSMEPGSMLSASVPADVLVGHLPDGAELAADNSTGLSVASGPADVMASLAAKLEAAGIANQILHTSHAFHSASMSEAAGQFTKAVAAVELSPPSIPLISNVTGSPITDEEATDPEFWGRQIRRPVRFADCLRVATAAGPTAFVELGPGRALSTFAQAIEPADGGAAEPVLAVPTMRHPRQDRDDHVVLLEAMGRLWTAGLPVDWDMINGPTPAQRVPLPTYPFERTEAWLPPYRHVLALPHFGPPTADVRPVRREPIDRWLYTPSWRREPWPDRSIPNGTTVVLAPAGESGDLLVERLRATGADIVECRPPNGADGDGDDQLAALFADLAEREVPVASVIHAWTAAPGWKVETTDDVEHLLDEGVHSVLACARGLSALSRRRPVRLDIVTTGAFPVLGSETIRPFAAALLGPAKVIPLEYSGVTTRLVDLPDPLGDEADWDGLLAELTAEEPDRVPDAVVALRGGNRWTPIVAVRPTTGESRSEGGLLRTGGRYAIVGGLGGVGLSIAKFLAAEYKASIVLTSRRGRPSPSDDDPESMRRIELLDEIERHASDVQVMAVDATDASAMAAMIEQVESDGRPIDGVIVAAGVADRYGAIHRRSRADMTSSVASKIHGLMALEEALGDRRLDFIMLSSSIAATLYHNRFAQVGYVTGNAFAEAFAHRGRQHGRRVVTVAWDDWLDVGMSVRAAQDFAADFGTDVDLVDKMNSFSPDEGVELFERALRTDEPVLLVSPTDLSRRLDDDVNVVSPFLEQAMGDDTDGDLTVDDPGRLTSVELVSSVWSALLGFERFEPNDDFFDLGGDSLQAARMVDRLSRAIGVEVPVDVVFDNSRLTRLADVLDELRVGDSSQPADRPTETLIGVPVPLGPAQLRFLNRATERPDHFNVSVLLRPEREVGEEEIRAALETAVKPHDALRLSFAGVGAGDGAGVGERHQVVGSTPPGDILTVVDLRKLADADAWAELERTATEVHESLDLEHGPILRGVLFQLPGGEQRLLLTIHHLVSDRISLLLLMDAIDAELRQPSSGQADSQSAGAASRSTPSFVDWVLAHRDAAVADHHELAKHWIDRGWSRLEPLPVDQSIGPDANRNSQADAVRVEIPAERFAVKDDEFDARPEELVLLALAQAVGSWSNAEAALIDVLGHGRRLPLGVDVSRSVGMFITYSPVLIELDDRGVGERLAALRNNIDNGWSFDALRFHGPDETAATIADLPTAEILFNYVGRPIATDGDAILVATDEPRGTESDPEGRRDHLIAVRADVQDDDSLALLFVYSTAIHDRSTIETLAHRTVEHI